MSMLKNMLGFDPNEIKEQVEAMARSAVGMHNEQARIAQFQNLLAEHVLKQTLKLDEILAGQQTLFDAQRAIHAELGALSIARQQTQPDGATGD